MSNTYGGDPSANTKDAVRFILSDTATPWKFSDEEIQYQLTLQGSPYAAAAELAMIMSARYTDRRDKTVGPLSIKYGELGDRWVKLATSLRGRAGRSAGAVAIMTQKNRGQTHFRLGMHDINAARDDYSRLLGDEELPVE